jgi:glycosyltransferase involved in cell wall biosynthesis
MKKPLVSIIVPTKNSSEFLDQCLESIKNQTYKNIELIVVDNNSTDNTKEIANRYTKLVFNKGPERSSQRNFGAKKSKGKYLLFIDSDMILTPKVVEECVNKNAKAIIVPEISIGEGFWAKCKALEKQCYIGDDTIEAARFFDKSLFWKSGAWNKDMIAAEDWDLTNRIRELTNIGRINSLIKHNEGRISLIQTLKKKYYYGQRLKPYLEKNKKKAKQQYKLIRPAYIRNWRLFLKDPIHGFGFIIMKVCEFGAGGLGYILK